MGTGELGEAVLSGRSGQKLGCGPRGSQVLLGAETVGGCMPTVLSPGLKMLVVGQHGFFFLFFFLLFHGLESWYGEGKEPTPSARRVPVRPRV